MNNIKQILKSEFSEDFVTKMKNRMVASFCKYGPLKKNVCRKDPRDNCDAIKNLKRRLALYEETGNTEWLIDAGNCAMIEFMHPQHPKAHFRATDSNESPGLDGISIREIEKLKQKDGLR